MVVAEQLDLGSTLPRISGAPLIGPGDTPQLNTTIRMTAAKPAVLEYRAEDETRGRFSLARIFEATVQAILIIPLAVVVCAIVAFAILPLHRGFRWDNLSDGQE